MARRRAGLRRAGSKYHAVPTVLGGHRFSSKREAARYTELQLLERAGRIQDLELQPVFVLTVAGVTLGRYVSDYRYTELPSGEVIVEDVKSQPTRTPIYKWKIKHLYAEHSVAVREV